MKKILCILSILIFGISYSQEKQTSDCELQTENKRWKAEYEKETSKTKRIELIKQKIKSDTIYSKYKPKIKTAHSSIIPNSNIDRNGNNCGCKILFVLQYSKEKSISIDLNSTPELNNVLESLNPKNITQLSHIFDEKIASAVFGTNGRCGVVQMTTENREIEQMIKNIW